MKTEGIKLFVEGLIYHIGLDPSTLKIAYKELHGGAVHFVCTAVKMQVQTLYEKVEGSKYMVTECAPTANDFLDLNDSKVLEEERHFTLAIFFSQSKRIRTLKKLGTETEHGDIFGIYLTKEASPFIIIVSHPKDGKWAVNFDFQLYKSEIEATKGEWVADIAVQFASIPNSTKN